VDGSINCTTIVDGKLVVTQNKVGASVAALQNNTGNIVVSDNPSIAVNVTVNGASATSGKVVIANNGLIGGTTTISTASSASVSGNTTSRRIEIKDVETFTVIGNNARTNAAEPTIWINPVTTSNVLSGVVSSNNVLIQTGTVGAGYVTIKAGVTGVTDVSNNKQTVAWT
jgi:hypothetical protein